MKYKDRGNFEPKFKIEKSRSDKGIGMSFGRLTVKEDE